VPLRLHLSAPLSGHARRGLTLTAVCISLSVITINISTLNVGLPSLARELGASNTGLEWIVDSYGLVFAGFLLTAGSLGDRLGRRQTLLLGLVIFLAGSIAAALVNTTNELIATRCVMGLGAACVMPMTLSILTNIYTTDEGLRRAIGVWAAVASGASVAAPVVAGLLLSHFWWGSIFVANIPTCAATIVIVAIAVPNSRTPSDKPIDWTGVVLSILFSAGLVGSLIEGPDRGWGDPLVVGGLLGSGALLVAFCLWELRTAYPLINVRFFRIPSFSAGCSVVSLQYFFSFGTSFAVTQYLQLVLGYSALKAGVALVPSSALVMVVAPMGARAFGRYGARLVTPLAFVVMAGSGTALVTVGVDSSYGPVFASMMLSSFSIGLMAAGTTSMVMRALPIEQSGMASGTQSATRQLGGALGVAIVGSLLAARYASLLTASLHQAGASAYAGTASRSLAAALDLPRASAATQALVAKLARSAFVDAVHVVGVGVIGLAILSAAILTIVLPRHERAVAGEWVPADAETGIRSDPSPS
jgi:EmrB/QacA subfamily drug resistance transporter